MGDISRTTPDGSGVVVRTICEVHREIYREIHDLYHKNVLNEESWQFITVRLEEAFEYAKKMNNKLRQYKHNYDDGWWDAHRLDGGELDELVRIQQEIANRQEE